MTEDLSVESNEKLVALSVTIEETFEELEERTAPRIINNHNETLVIDLEDE